MDMVDVVDLAQQFSDLGWAVREQLITIVEGEDNDTNINPNAARMIAEWASVAQSRGVEDADALFERAMEWAEGRRGDVDR